MRCGTHRIGAVAHDDNGECKEGGYMPDQLKWECGGWVAIQLN